MIIRRGALADLPDVQRLNQELFQHEHDAQFYDDESYNLNWPYEEGGIKYFTECLGENPTAALFLAVDEGRAVGYLAASFYNRTYRSHNPVGYLDNMYVDPEHRSAGVGTALIDAFKTWAKDNQVLIVRVSAMARNHRAQSFYRKNGFTDREVTLEQSIRPAEHDAG